MCIDCVGGNRNDGESLVMRADDTEQTRDDSSLSDDDTHPFAPYDESHDYHYDADDAPMDLSDEDKEYTRLKNRRTIAALLTARGIPVPESLAFAVD